MSCIGSDNPCRVAGDDILYSIQFTDNLGVGIDLTGATATMVLKDAVTDSTVVQTMTGGITTPLAGDMEFTLTDVESAALLPRSELEKSWVFSVKITYADLSEQTILDGTFKLEQKATA